MILFISLACIRFDAHGDDSLGEPLSQYSQAVKAISSYDVFVNHEVIFLLKQQIAGYRDIGGRKKIPVVEFVDYEPGEPTLVRTGRTRQTRDRLGRRRVEIFPSKLHREHAILAFDGEKTRVFHPDSTSGSVRSRSPEQKPLLTFEYRYDAIYREVLFGGAFSELFARRPHLEVKAAESAVVVDSPPQSSNMYPKFHFELTLDPQHNHLPVRIVSIFPGGNYNVMNVLRFREIDGVWVPTEAETDSYCPRNEREKGELTAVTKTIMKLDLAKSKWNEPLDEEISFIEFPIGTSVVDLDRQTKRTVYRKQQIDWRSYRSEHSCRRESRRAKELLTTGHEICPTDWNQLLPN